MKSKIVFGCLLLTTGSFVAQPTEISMEQAEQRALARDPDIQAFLDRAAAYEHLAVAQLELPDLRMRFGLMNYPLEHGDFRTEGMTHSIIGLRQAIPPRGLRPALSEKSEHLAREQDLRSVNHARELIRKVRYAWLNAYYYEHKLILNHTAHKLFGDLLHLARTLYATGDGSKSDILQVELEQFKIEDRVLEIEQSRDHAYIALGEYLGAEELFAVSSQLPHWTAVSSLATLQSALGNHPRLTAISAQADAYEAQRRVEESNMNRQWTIDLSYGYRDGGLASGASRSDLLSASISFNVPLWGQQKYQQKIVQTNKQHSATLLQHQSTLRELKARLETAHKHWTTLGSRLALYEQQIIPKIDQQATVALESYENQAHDLSLVIQSYLSKIDADDQRLRLSIERLKIWADIDELVGVEEL